MSNRIPALALLALALPVALACGGSGTDGHPDVVIADPGMTETGPDDIGDIGASEDVSRDVPDLGVDVAVPEVLADAPVDVPADLPADVHADDPGSPDVPADPGVADPGVTDVPPADVPAADAGDVPLTPEPWVQCTDDAPCKAVFGEYAICNLDFPGGQCMGCDPEAPGVHVKCTSLSHDLTDVTLSCRMANGGVCLYDCPCPSWLRCLENEQLCVLKTCSTDADCGPFPCRPIDEGGTSYCLPPK